jgi:dihydrodipicolinate synthase/N-acetylneuraminate lyase
MNVIKGIIPVAPTIFTNSEELDLMGQRRVVDFLVDGKSDAVCILANYSEQFSLSDEERELIIAATLDQASDRLPVCVTTSHFSARIAARRSRQAQERGATMVMLMAPFFGTTMKVDDDAVMEYFKRVADGLEIDIMVQDAPMSPTVLSVALLARLAAEIPQINYAKIEMPQAADKLRMLITATGDNLPGVYDGEEAITLIPDLDAGAQGTMSSCMVPDQLGQIVRDFHAGDRDKAVAQWENLLPFIHFENRQCGLRATKVLMKEGRIIKSDKVRAPLGELHPDTRLQLVEMAKRRDPLVLRWG